MAGRRIVTLTTDFGLDGPYVGAVKGAILSVNPQAHIVDIAHAIPPGDVAAAAFVLGAACTAFPEGTLHLAVVDPGVGSSRRPLFVSTENHYFIGPDNGVFTHVLNREELYGVFELAEEQYFRNPVSPTFHGRDIFAPVAGWFTKGIDSARFGPPVSDMASLVRLPFTQPTEVKPKAWKCAIIYVDHFGNLVTNLSPRQVPLDEGGRPDVAKAVTKKGEVAHFVRFYQEGPDGVPAMYFGSSGYYEIGVKNGSAAQTMGLVRGSEIGVIAK